MVTIGEMGYADDYLMRYNMVMLKKEILGRVIAKAVANGYCKGVQPPEAHLLIAYGDVYGVIFSHPFAKALWGEGWHFNVGDKQKGTKCHLCGGGCTWYREGYEPDNPYDNRSIKCYQANLQRMVLTKDPVRYLKDFI